MTCLTSWMAEAPLGRDLAWASGARDEVRSVTSPGSCFCFAITRPNKSCNDTSCVCVCVCVCFSSGISSFL